MANDQIQYVTAPKVDDNRKKYCRLKKNGIKYIDYKDANFLLKFINDQGKVLPRRLTGTSLKFQRKVHRLWSVHATLVYYLMLQTH